MKYMGSKNRIAKYILPIILKDRKIDQYYVEPFCGGCNLIDKVDGKRIANDSNKYLISMFKTLILGWDPPYISKEEYQDIRMNKDKYPDYLVGWVGFNVSYRGKFFGGYAGKVNTKINTIRDYQIESNNNIKNQIPNLKNIEFYNMDYKDLTIPEHSIIYCDIPYKNTTDYKDGGFDHEKFWNWAREKSKVYSLFVSEYQAPEDFECIWSMKLKNSLSNNGKSGNVRDSEEKLFVFKG